MPDGTPDMDRLRAGGASVAGLYGDVPDAGGPHPLPDGEERVSVYHCLKTPQSMALAYDAFYVPFGWPPSTVVLGETNQHSGEGRCHYSQSTWRWAP